PVVIDLDQPVDLVLPEPSGRSVSSVRTDSVEIVHQGQRFVFARPDVFGDHAADLGDGAITAPMPGTVLDVRVAEGHTVAAGDVVAVVEAMKMQNELLAPRAGTVTRVLTSEGAAVERGAVLVELE
ncbi:MAG: biotin/lipoyl-binding protein, partial [Myxococcota bacterium]|nr:biotin/lipoyl-binding protein [Myxococcota bacterium]